MRYFRIIYEKREAREVWVEVPEDAIVCEENADSVATQVFWNEFEKYDSESDEHDGAGLATEVLLVDEIDENGDEI